VRILKSMPMVVMKEGVNESSLNRSRQHDFPTPESPIKSSLICGDGLVVSRHKDAWDGVLGSHNSVFPPCCEYEEEKREDARLNKSQCPYVASRLGGPEG
jgi:hypothetical protein